jgi:hypothetical protein
MPVKAPLTDCWVRYGSSVAVGTNVAVHSTAGVRSVIRPLPIDPAIGRLIPWTSVRLGATISRTRETHALEPLGAIGRPTATFDGAMTVKDTEGHLLLV